MLDKKDVPDLMLKPSPAVLFLLGVAVSFGIIVGILTFISRSGVAYGAVLFFGAVFIWLYVGSVRIKLYPNRLEMLRFWRRKWNATLADVVIKDGRAGDFSVIPAILIVDRVSGNRVGEILKSQFKPSDLVALKEAIVARGGEVAAPPSKTKRK
jgi:hypothetical protein